MADSISIDQRADVVRTAFAGFGAEDPGAIADAFHPDGELILSGGLALLTGGSHRGRDAVRAWFEDWFETMELTAAGVEHMAPVGDRMLMVANQRSRSASVGAPAATRFAVICSFRDGLIGRFELYQDPDEARRSLGLDRWPWDEHTVAVEPFDSPDARALRAELETDLAERYGGDTEPGVKSTEDTVLAFLVARDPVKRCGAVSIASGSRPASASRRRWVSTAARATWRSTSTGRTATRRCRAASSGGCARRSALRQRPRRAQPRDQFDRDDRGQDQRRTGP